MKAHVANVFCLSLMAATGACTPEVTTGGLSGGEESDSQQVTADRTAESAIVGQKARVTASALNLRTGPSTNNGIILTMSQGTIVDVTAVSSGWYKVDDAGHIGWCTGAWLTPVANGNGNGNGNGNTIIDQAIARAQSGVGFSYHWGQGCWDPASTAHGSCLGSCPNCSHSGQWGADCSGYVAKVWQVPGAMAVTSCSHPYSTWNFFNTHDHWTDVPRSNARRGDAFVHNDGSSGHIFIYDGGDAWGWLTAYEAKGCSYGIVKDSRTAGTNYKVIRREGF